MVRAHKETIYTVCYMFAKDADEVNDLFQEVLINLWSGLGQFRGESKMGTWVYRVSLNTCISSDRKKKQQATVPLTMDINLFEDNDEERAKSRCSTNASISSSLLTAPSYCFGSRT